MSKDLQVLYLVVVIIALAVVIRWFLRFLSGDGYYQKYPGARLIDDMARQGKLSEPVFNEIMDRVGFADDMAEEVLSLRDEYRGQAGQVDGRVA